MTFATRSLRLLSCQPLTCKFIRYASNLYKRMKLLEEREREIVAFKKSRDQGKRARVTYVWGSSTSGALGVKSFLEAKNERSRVLVMNRPYQLGFFVKHNMEVTHVAAGYGFSLFAARNNDQERAVYGTGVNTDSQLSYLELGRKKGRILDYVLEPAMIKLPVSSEVRIRHLACGRAHSIIVTDEGTFSLGNNSFGQCGRTVIEGEIYKGSQVINKIEVPDDIKQVVCGQDHTVFLTEGGDLYACGLGSDGQTGQGHYDVTCRLSRMRGTEGRKVVQVSSMADTVLAVTDTGEVYGCGNSEFQQLLSAPNAVQANEFLPLPLADVGHVTNVATGGTMCAVLNDKGNVYVWGFGILGQGPNVDHAPVPILLPDPLFGKNEYKTDTKVVDIQAGISQMAAITNDGELYTWGSNAKGILGLGLRSQAQYFPFRCCVPAHVERISMGVDHMIAQCRAYR